MASCVLVEEEEKVEDEEEEEIPDARRCFIYLQSQTHKLNIPTDEKLVVRVRVITDLCTSLCISRHRRGAQRT